MGKNENKKSNILEIIGIVVIVIVLFFAVIGLYEKGCFVINFSKGLDPFCTRRGGIIGLNLGIVLVIMIVRNLLTKK